jgi:hypothetical protein
MGVGDVGDGDAEKQDGSNKLQGDKLDGLTDKANGTAEDQQEQHSGEQGEPGGNAIGV